MGKRVGVSSSNYSTSAITRRTGLTRQEVNQLRSEGRQAARGGGIVSQAAGRVGIQREVGAGSARVSGNGNLRYGTGGAGITYNPNSGSIGVSGFGFGVTVSPTGGSVSLPGGIKITTYEKGCYIVQVHSIFGQETFSNIQKKPECDNDDDDDDSGGDEPKPPHCRNPDGSRGKGSPRNLMPECLNDGNVHTFYWVGTHQDGGVFNYPQEPSSNGGSLRRMGFESFRINENGAVVGASFDELEVINSDGVSTTTPAYEPTENALPFPYGYNRFTGTYTELEELLRNQSWNTASGYPMQGLPAVYTEVENRWHWRTGSYTFTHDKWGYAWVISPDGNCNPTGNEGCGGKPSPPIDNGTSDSSKPHPTGLHRRPVRDTIKRRDSDDEKEMDRCCANVKKIAKALAVDEVLGDGLSIPGRLIAYKATEKITMKSYLEIMETHFRVADNLGIHPIEIKIQDSNKSQEGDQSYEVTFINATAAIKQLLELGLENKGDAADRLGILFRIAWINVQILSTAVTITRGVQGLMQFIGLPFKEKVEKVWMPFDVTLGTRDKITKGFAKTDGKKPTDDKIKKTMELRDEDSLESVLPSFLNSVEQPVMVETYNDSSGTTLLDMIRRLIK